MVLRLKEAQTWHICDGKQRPYTALLCSFCRGRQTDKDIKLELKEAHGVIEKLKRELKHARDVSIQENLNASNEMEKRLEIEGKNKALRNCLDKIQGYLARAYQGHYDKS